MENKNSCPCCNEELVYEQGKYLCNNCSKKFETEYFCDICGSKLEKLQACGALNFFCNSCNELKSKSKVIKKIKEI